MFRSQGAILQTLRLNKLVNGTLVLHGHDYNGAAVKLINNVLPSNRNAGTYSQRMSADSFTVEVQGAFVLTELVITASSGGTHLQYAPPVKKFSRLLYSQLYSIEGEASTVLPSTPEFAAGRFDPVMLSELNTPVPSFVFGELRPVLIQFAQPYQNQDAVQSPAPSFVSGLLTSVLITHDQLYQTGDAVTSAPPTFISGQLAEVLIAHNQIYQTGDAVESPHPTFISGVLA
jgi:hypothetical protein